MNVHIRAEGAGKWMTLVLTPGPRHEAVTFAAMRAGGAVQRGGGGRPKQRPRRVGDDKAYSSGKMRQYRRRHGIRMTIPQKQNVHRTDPFDRALYRLRERVERLINRLKHHRRLATRYEKCAVNSHAMWLIAATLLWL
jgi:transposase